MGRWLTATKVPSWAEWHFICVSLSYRQTYKVDTSFCLNCDLFHPFPFDLSCKHCGKSTWIIKIWKRQRHFCIMLAVSQWRVWFSRTCCLSDCLSLPSTYDISTRGQQHTLSMNLGQDWGHACYMVANHTGSLIVWNQGSTLL